MIKAVLFDLDDTLVDHNTAIRSAAGALFERVIPNRKDDCQAFVERWISLNRKWYNKFFTQQVTFPESSRGKLREAFSSYAYQFLDTDADTLLSGYWEHYVSMCQLFNDVNECLMQLQECHIKVGVVTNGQETQQVEKLRRCGIMPILDVVVTSEAAEFAKPLPQIFFYACNKLGVQEIESIYVGDNLELDAIAARNAGLVGVWLDRLNTDSLKSPPNVKRINQLTDLYHLFQS